MENTDEKEIAQCEYDLTKVFDALSHPVRVEIIGILSGNRQYVSELARALNISRPLLYMHLQKLEAAHLIAGSLEISADGKAMKYYSVRPFAFQITPETLLESSKKTAKSSDCNKD